MKHKCKECFMKGCDCPCETCEAARERNCKMSNLELTRLSVATALAETTVVSPKTKKILTKMGLL